MNSLTQELTTEAQDLIQQLKKVVVSVDDTMYASPISLLSGASIGAHVRHTLEFFDCLLNGANAEEINYDKRKRDQEIEVSRAAAMVRIDALFNELGSVTINRSLKLVSQGLGAKARTMGSSLERELWYTIEHAIHHMAIIKIGILHQSPGFVFPEHFGVASSTVIFQQLQN
jgi:uncharacterized damage-inducible protein DinB